MEHGNTEVSKGLAVIVGLLIVFSGIQAYAIGPIPTTWISNSGFVGIAILFVLSGRRINFPGVRAWIIFSVWMCATTIFGVLTDKYSHLMPSDSFLDYESYTALRVFNLLVFLCTVATVFSVLRAGHFNVLTRTIVWGATILSVFAAYIYIAQNLGLPEPPRTRVGTGGGEQSVIFAYEFHRAMGATREPSHLAEWLVFPISLCALYIPRTRYLHLTCQLCILLLTGSLLGILGLILGIVVASSASLLWSSATLNETRFLTRTLVVAVVVMPLALVGFYWLAVGTDVYSPDLFAQLSERIVPMLQEGGLRATNRDYTYEFLDGKEMSLIGDGLGHPNLELSQYLGIPVVASLLSLYGSVLLSGGWIGLAFLVIALLQPVTKLIKLGEAGVPRLSTANVLFVAYASWLFMFSAHEDELLVMFGVVYAFLSFSIYQRDLIYMNGAGKEASLAQVYYRGGNSG